MFFPPFSPDPNRVSVIRIVRLPIALLLLLGTLAAAVPSRAQVTELLLSEYVEGNSNNKAIEIYNGTDAVIDLAAGGYELWFYHNKGEGGEQAVTELSLRGSVPPGEVFVVAQQQAAQTVLDAANPPNNGQVFGDSFFNGSDTVALLKGEQVVDSLGRRFELEDDQQWSSANVSTRDRTLRRKAEICRGDTNIEDFFDPAVEWDPFAIDTFDGLGEHSIVETCPAPPPQPLAPALRVSDGEAPDLAFDAAGEALVVFENSDAGEVRIRGQLLSATGVVIVQDVRLSGAGALNPAVAFDPLSDGSDFAPAGPASKAEPAGARLVVWDEEDRPSSIHGQLERSGRRLGPPRELSTRPTSQERPAVTPVPEGGFLVVWESVQESGSDTAGSADNESGIFGRLVNRFGRPLDPPESRIDSALRPDPQRPAAASNGSDLLVVWDAPRGARREIEGQRLTAEGDLIGNELRLTDAPGSQTDPDLVFDDDVRRFLVVWEDESGIGGRLLRPAGARQGEPFLIGAAGDRDPKVDSESGLFVVTWARPLGTRSVPLGHLVDGDGQPVGREFRISDRATTRQGGGEDESSRPAVAFVPPGVEAGAGAADVFFVAWQEEAPVGSEQEVLNRRFAIRDDSACAGLSTALCLNRFKVEVDWHDFDGNTGAGQVVPVRSDDSGLFYFFTPGNWEMLVKVLDGCAITDSFWVFAAATTNVEYTLRVTDTVTGSTVGYFNELGNAAAAITDTAALPVCTESAAAVHDFVRLDAAGSLAGVDTVASAELAKGSSCLPGPDHLCLNESRFQVEVEWRDFDGNTGIAQVVPFGSDDSGLLWFFDGDNWEMLVKVLNGCSITDHFWVFAAATTNVEYTLRVIDTETGVVKEYFNPLGTSAAAVTDTEALATCP